jgi:hypothetical protein
MLFAEPKLSGGEQSVDHIIMAAEAIIDEFGPAALANDEQRRSFFLAEGRRELDEHLPPVVEGAKRPPGRTVALDPIVEVQRLDRNPGSNRLVGGRTFTEHNERVLRI